MSGLRTNVSTSINALFGYRSSVAKSSDASKPFRGADPAQAKLLQKSFKGLVRTPQVLSKPGTVQVLRNNRTGLFNLDSFVRVKQGPPLPIVAPQQGLALQQGNGHQGAAIPQQVAVPAPVLSWDQRTADLDHRLGEANDLVTPWLLTVDRDQPASNGALRKSTFARDAAIQKNAGMLAELRVLHGQVSADQTIDNPEQNRRLGELEQKMRQCVSNALLLTLPGLAKVDGADKTQLIESVLKLDGLLRGAAVAGGITSYRLEKALALLASHGQIQDFARGPLPEKQKAAAVGLQAMADTIVRAATPPSDGSALNSLLGMDVEMDAVLKQVRIKATTDLMLTSEAVRQGGPIEGQQVGQTIRQEAQEVVERDIGLAKMKQQVRRALERSGQSVTMTGLGGLKVDAGLVKGLRATLGNNAKEIGLVVAALAMAEQQALTSPGANRLRGDIDQQLAALRLQRAQVASGIPDPPRPPSELREERAGLKEQMAMVVLPIEIEQLEGQLRTVEQQLATHEQNTEPLREIDSHIATLEARQRALQTEAAYAAGEFAKADAAFTELDARRAATTERRGLLDVAVGLDIQLAQLGQRPEGAGSAAYDVEWDRLDKALQMARATLAETVDTQLEEIQQQATELQQHMQQATGPQRSLLDTRLQYLRAQVAQIERENQAGSLTEKMQLATSHLTEATERLALAGKSRDYWQGRVGASTVPQELTAARQTYDRDDAALRVAKNQLNTAIGSGVATDIAARRQDVTRLEGVRADALRNLRAEEVRYTQQAAGYGAATLLGGLTEAELRKMGLSAAESREVMQTVAGLAKQGLASAEQVEAVLSDVNKVFDRFNARRSMTNTSIADQMAALTAAKNEDQAKNLGNRLIQNLTLGKAGATVADKMQAALIGTLDAPGVLASGGVVGGVHPADDSLLAQAQQFGKLENELFVSTNLLASLDQAHQDARAMIQRVDPARNLDHPAGLAMARNLIEAANLLARHPNMAAATVPAADRARFDAICQSLKGLDQTNLTLPFWQFNKAAPTEGQLRVITADQQKMEAARAIVFLREGEAALRQEKHTEIASTVAEMDRVVQSRIEAMGSSWAPLRDSIRGAILTQFGATQGATLENFRPADHAEAIKNTLLGWGVPVDRVAPEINMMLSQSFGVEELNLWAANSNLTNLAAARDVRAEQLEKASEPGKTGINPQAKAALLDGIDRMASGTKVKLVAGDRVEVQTGNIPVEPTGIATVNVKVAVGKLDGIEIERGSDGYQLVLRDGWDGKAGGELSATVPGLSALSSVGLKLQGTASVEAAGYRVTGAAIRFPNNEAGKAALKDTLEALLTKSRIEARDLSKADDIMPLVEARIGGKAGVGFKLGFDPFGVDALGTGDIQSDVGTVRARIKGGVAVSGNTVSYATGNTNLEVNKGEKTYTVELSLAAGLNMKVNESLASAWGGEKASTSTDLASVQVTAIPYHYKAKSKATIGPDGLVRAAEIQRQSFTPPINREGVVFDRLGGGDGFRRLFDSLTEPEKASIQKLISLGTPEDMISITFALDDRVRTAVNERLEEAKALRSGRIATDNPSAAIRRAEALEAAAQQLLDDDNNYIPSKLQLIPTIETQRTLVGLNLLFVNWTAYNEDKSEWVAAEVSFNADKARAAMYP